MLEENLIELGKHLYEQPINYKYYGADTALTVLTNDTLQFSHPSVFNDPFDCNVSLFAFEEETVRLHMEDLIKRDKGNNYVERFRLHRNLNSKIMPVAKDFMQHIFNTENSNRGVTCFSKSSVNMLMWAHYATCHTGVCLGYDLLSLRHYIVLKNRESCLIPVRYKESIVPIKDFQGMEMLHTWFGSKHAMWQYEEEIRMISRPLILDENRKYYFKIPVEIIKEVHLGTSINSEKRAEIMKLAKDRFPHVKIFQVKADYSSFTLIKQQLI